LFGALTEETQAHELRRLVVAATPRTRWYEALTAAIDADFARAADLYAAIGSQPDEAVARLRAARQASAAGDSHQARAQFTRAWTFFTRVGVHVSPSDAEMLAPT
jgi:hypothetical protein